MSLFLTALLFVACGWIPDWPANWRAGVIAEQWRREALAAATKQIKSEAIAARRIESNQDESN